MVQKMQENAFDLVLDATHPYAREASDNIRRAAAETSVPYLRVCRRESDASDGIHVGSVEEAVEFLSHTKGNVLAVTGSKELSKYRKLADYRIRVYPRILPDAQTIMDCMSVRRQDLSHQRFPRLYQHAAGQCDQALQPGENRYAGGNLLKHFQKSMKSSHKKYAETVKKHIDEKKRQL